MNIIIGIIIIILLVVGAYYLFGNEQPTVENGLNQSGGTEEFAVVYTDSGFSPRSVTIDRGDTVVFTNQSSREMWVASAMHPTHTVYSGTPLSQHCPDTANDAFDQCEARDSFRFTFDKAGTWNYHNHLDPSNTGSVVVQ